jgi:hypothetical protein
MAFMVFGLVVIQIWGTDGFDAYGRIVGSLAVIIIPTFLWVCFIIPKAKKHLLPEGENWRWAIRMMVLPQRMNEALDEKKRRANESRLGH